MSEFDKNKYSKKATTPPPLPPSVKNDDEIKRLMKQGMAEDSAGLMAGLSSLSGVATKLAAGVVAVAGVVKGANNYLLQQGTDRFNFAQELRHWSSRRTF